MRRLTIVTAILCAGFPAAACAQDVPHLRTAEVIALAKVYFRDSAEVPMDVAVTSVVTDRAGKSKRRESTVQMVFSGYSLEAGRFRLNGNSGLFNTGALRDSMSGNMASFVAPLFITPGKDRIPEFDIQEPAEAGQPVVVKNRPSECPAFVLMPPGRYLYPQKTCGDQQITIVNASGGWIFSHYRFESGGVPVMATVPYLGAVKIRSFRSEVDFHAGTLPGDPKPFLWPSQAVTVVTADKGTITLTNRYSPHPPRGGR
jgi:hypothetical protein